MNVNPGNESGFSLVEVVFALGVTSFCLIIILALLPAGLGANRVSIQQTEATNLATAIVADLRQTPSVAAIAASGGNLNSQSPRYGIDVTQASKTLYLDVNGTSSLTLTADSRYKVNITLNQPASGQKIATNGNISVTWPASASTPQNSVLVFIALDRN